MGYSEGPALADQGESGDPRGSLSPPWIPALPSASLCRRLPSWEEEGVPLHPSGPGPSLSFHSEKSQAASRLAGAELKLVTSAFRGPWAPAPAHTLPGSLPRRSLQSQGGGAAVCSLSGVHPPALHTPHPCLGPVQAGHSPGLEVGT